MYARPGDPSIANSSPASLVVRDALAPFSAAKVTPSATA
jgi:hypothetical protein